MRIGDWSSDVCSSDLPVQDRVQELQVVGAGAERGQAGRAALEDLAQVVEFLDRVQRELDNARAVARVEPYQAVARQALQGLADRRAADAELRRQGGFPHPIARPQATLADRRRSEEHTSELQSLMR